MERNFKINLTKKNQSVATEVQKLLLLHEEQQRTGDIDSTNSKRHILFEKYDHKSIFGLKIFDPTKLFPVCFDLLMQVIDATYCCFLIPIYVGFQIYEGQTKWSTYLDLAVGPIFVANLFLKFQTGVSKIQNYNLKKEMNGLKIAKGYVKKAQFYLDVLAIIPFILLILVIYFPQNKEKDDIHILMWAHSLRFPRALWFIKRMFTSSFSVIQRSENIDSSSFFLLNIVFTTAVIVNFGACIWYGSAMIEGLKNSWVHAHGIMYKSKSRHYVSSVYFALTVMTTTGFGDITPQNQSEEIAAIFLLILGVIMFAFIISTASNYLSNISSKAKRVQMFREKMKKVSWWTERRGLCHSTLKTIRSYYWEVWTRLQQDSEKEVFQEIPPHLQAIVAVELVGGLFRELPAFQNLSNEQIYLLASRMTPVEVIVNHELFREGDESTGIWVLEQGLLRASALDGSEDSIEAPDIVGEALLWSPKFDKYCQTTVDTETDPVQREKFEVRRITYTAKTTCQLWFLKVKDLITLASVIPGLIDNIKSSITSDLESQLVSETRENIQVHKKHLIQSLQRSSNLFQDYNAPKYRNLETISMPYYKMNQQQQSEASPSKPKRNSIYSNSNSNLNNSIFTTLE